MLENELTTRALFVSSVINESIIPSQSGSGGELVTSKIEEESQHGASRCGFI